MYYGHELGYVIRRLREMWVTGATGADLRAYLQERLPVDEAYRQQDYICRAFLQHMTAIMNALPPGRISEAKERTLTKLLNENRALWEKERFPELMRVRDYFSFLQFAKDEHLIVTICGANPTAGDYVGRKGYRCFIGRLFVIASETGPNPGILSARPDDLRLLAALDRYAPPLSYEGYVARLDQLGYRVRAPEHGYALEDGAGNLIYEGYRLHGVYDAQSGTRAWTAKRGERLRTTINRMLGEELIHFGPHDDWEARNDPRVAGPLAGPQLPALSFDSEYQIENLITIDDMGWGLPEVSQHWHRLYPNHPVRR